MRYQHAMAGDAQAERHVAEVCDILGCEVLEVAAILGLHGRPTLRSRVALHSCMPSLLEDGDAWVFKAEVSRGLFFLRSSMLDRMVS